MTAALPDCNPSESRQRLIRAAYEAFVEEGYRASIDHIAARAGVARQTLYNHFPSKDDLFSEVAHQATDLILVSLEDTGDDIRGPLLRFGVALRARLLSGPGVAMFRTLAAEAPRFPLLAQAFFNKGPARTMASLGAFLGRAMADGRLRRDSAQFAAEMLVSMLEGFDRTRQLFGVAEFDPARDPERVALIVDAFLRSYAPDRSAT